MSRIISAYLLSCSAGPHDDDPETEDEKSTGPYDDDDGGEDQ